jgi:hypothetical protein
VVAVGEAIERFCPDPIDVPLPHPPAYQFNTAPDPPEYERMIFPASSAQKLLRSTDALIGATTGIVTVTPVEAALVHIAVAVALAVITSPPDNAARLLKVHALLLTVVVPSDVNPLKTSITVPSFSELVPLTDVAPAQIGEDTSGVEVFIFTCNADE